MSFCYFLPGFRCVEQEDQLVTHGCTTKSTYNGPQFAIIPPFNSHSYRKAITLQPNEYIKTENTSTGNVKIERGPKLLFLGPYETKIYPKNSADNAKAISLGPIDYIIVENEQTGELREERGPLLWFPSGIYDNVVKHDKAIALKLNQYVKLMDTQTGVIRVEKGESIVYPTATEEVLGRGVQDAVNIDKQTAALIRDTEDGQLYLVTKQGLFYPTPYQEIVTIQQKIVLEDHETVILKDKDGKFHFKHGGHGTKLQVNTAIEKKEQELRKATQKHEILLELPKDNEEDDTEVYDDAEEFERAFFLPPYCKLVELEWTIGDTNRRVVKIDRRPQFMNYEFVCRTCDNVELVVEVTFFWKVIDVKAMIHHTSNAPGDICAHARSVIIQVASQVTLEKFMAEFNHIIAAAILNEDDHFYLRRGCHIHTVEVRSIRCKDEDTEHVLQEIIQETTHRLSRLQKTESENEVKIFKMKGVIEHEKLITDLIRIRSDHMRQEAECEGRAEADKIRAFLEGLNDMPDVDTASKIAMWNTLRKQDVIEKLGESDSTMYFTPNDVNLSIETFENPKVKNRVKKPKKDARDGDNLMRGKPVSETIKSHMRQDT